MTLQYFTNYVVIEYVLSFVYTLFNDNDDYKSFPCPMTIVILFVFFLSRRISQAVLVIVLGFLCTLLGIMLTIFGAHSRQSPSRYRLVFGPIIIFLGIFFSIAGGVVYFIFQRKRSQQPEGGGSGTSGGASTAIGGKAAEEENLITNCAQQDTSVNGVKEDKRHASVRVQRKRTKRNKDIPESKEGTPAKSIESTEHLEELTVEEVITWSKFA